MKVFLSWSGAKSKAVAELTNEWLQCVLQSLRPWISTKGIDGGSLWFTEISNELNDTGIGIVFLTQENKNSPWIMFESGALAKGLSSNRVCTFLIDLEPQDINNPLANFNHTFPTKESILRLIYMLNNLLGDSGLDVSVLEKVFEKYWPDYESGLARIEESHDTSETEEEERKPDDILSEILLTTRSLSNRLAGLERREASKSSNQNESKTNEDLTIDDINKIISRYISSNKYNKNNDNQIRKVEIKKHGSPTHFRKFRDDNEEGNDGEDT
ncbi:hypothetical protein FIU83_06320 [Halomonas sp. THAF5a]|uniref:toll/interleukin-1 receptor domain-containing protein n=1 Tax=Halomonas sp. THAF5a TaxID=2587844 RepID=UPI001267DD48|nr:toll/interleukin-1 receptor domain-containing protein [Halomonas sp. THAF5a]QFU01250.1 hypothetical protein FIU83_06320 [Halomonas sp. THAF5a]